MTALCLLIVLVLAKLLVLAGHGMSLSSGLWPVVFFWQDVAVALVVAAIDAIVRRARVVWAVYALAVMYIAVSVPITLVLGSPLTWTMLRAARGPLADSVTHYFTAWNLGSAAVVLVTGACAPFLLASLRARFIEGRGGVAHWRVIGWAVALAITVAGSTTASRVDTLGLDRNALTALVPIALPRVEAAAATSGNWRDSPFASPSDESLAQFRGAAAGFNVVIVVLESTGAMYLRSYGAVEDPMPNLTAFSRHAIQFEHAYATYPESIKGLFTTLCSRYAAFGLSAEVHAGVPCRSLAQELGKAGYRTSLFHSGRFGYLGMDAVIANKGFDVLEDAGAIGGNVHSSFGVDEPSTVKRLFGWIDSMPAGTPFLATYLPIAGHHPYATPTVGPFPVHSERDQYLNALHDGDESLGALLEGLRARSLDRRTVVVVFGDHGEAFGQHPGNIGHTLFINEENVRVPYLISIPGATTAPLVVARVASLVDTAPTVLDLLGLPSPAEYQGTSLLAPGARMALFMTDYSLGLLGLRDGCWKYTFEINAGRSKLFEVCRDPNETVDVGPHETARARAYRDRVQQWSSAQKALVERERRRQE